MGIEFKQIELDSYINGKVNFLSITGKLEKDDYDLFVPALEASIKNHGRINLLVELIDFHGWTAGALWEDTKFGFHHFNDIDKLGIIGDQKWEENLARFAKVFTTAEVKYFNESKLPEAYRWISETP